LPFFAKNVFDPKKGFNDVLYSAEKMALLLSYFVLFCQNVFDPKKGFNDVLQNCFKPHTGLNIASPVARCTPQEGVRFWSDEMELNGVI
jgi:hypothetical protein